jgi:hypothetical protein
MANVSEVAFQYSAKGAKAVQRADRKVRNSVQETAKTAQEETGTINRWMERNQTALRGIGAAAAGALGAIVAASPTMRAELASARIAFSLFADTVINDVLPAGRGVSDVAFELQQRYEELDPSIRGTTSALIVLAGVLGAITVAIGGFAALVAGAFIAQIALLTSVLERFGALDSVMSAWLNMGRAVVAFLTGDFSGAWQLLVAAFWDFVDAGTTILQTIFGAIRTWLGKAKARAIALVGETRDGIIDKWKSLKSGTVEWFKDVYDAIKDRLGDIKSDAIGWGKNLARGFISGLLSMRNALSNAAKKLKETISNQISFADIGFGGIKPILSQLVNVLKDLRETVTVQRSSTVTTDVVGSNGGNAGGNTVSIGDINIDLQGTGASRRDAQNIADQVSQQINDQFESRR